MHRDKNGRLVVVKLGNLSNFAKNMTISIISSDKDKFLKGQPGHGSQMIADSLFHYPSYCQFKVILYPVKVEQ